MTNIFIFLFSTIFAFSSCTKIDHNLLKCLVCEKSLEELNVIVSKLDPKQSVDVGGYQLDAEGNYRQKTISQSKSEVKLSELIENICEKMDDYVRATFKSNGTLTLLKLMTDEGMNPAMSDVDIIQDDDLNKSLKYNCESIMEEFEDSIIQLYQNEVKNISNKICNEESKLCTKYSKRKEEL